MLVVILRETVRKIKGFLRDHINIEVGREGETTTRPKTAVSVTIKVLSFYASMQVELKRLKSGRHVDKNTPEL